MRTLLNKLKDIEQHVFGTAAPGDALVFDARIIIDQDLADDVALQKEAYAVIKRYGRQQLRAELETVHQQVFTQARHQSFKQKITALFK
ncbi:hypothetical protein [Mucilaginibacter myungsuensis]|uniref:Uncharacterized protein n=1 Tax=Mucilaginibacter myungsuensis TaxID=649104 RepID=A0A929KX47_9SPHI|nr:hypothetical protein [Mucilaginibacter myungsuensis]MBE9663264.1 hypothetical protein [Mucilaginibacter myungsuensis]MDN3598898.1 hypothetical protein [Mucilaginibacter myungsuensis]